MLPHPAPGRDKSGPYAHSLDIAAFVIASLRLARRIVTATVKSYLLQRDALLSKFTSNLEEAGNLLGVSRERVRQLIHEGKIDAIDVSTNGDTHSRWMVSRDSIQGRVEGLRLPSAG